MLLKCLRGVLLLEVDLLQAPNVDSMATALNSLWRLGAQLLSCQEKETARPYNRCSVHGSGPTRTTPDTVTDTGREELQGMCKTSSPWRTSKCSLSFPVKNRLFTVRSRQLAWTRYAASLTTSRRFPVLLWRISRHLSYYFYLNLKNNIFSLLNCYTTAPIICCSLLKLVPCPCWWWFPGHEI